MRKDSSDNITEEKRSEPRSTKLRDYRVEIKFVGEPMLGVTCSACRLWKIEDGSRKKRVNDST